MNRKVLIGCAVLLLAAILGLAIADGRRQWKRLQVEFFELERRQLAARLDAARAEAGDVLAEIEAEVEIERERLSGRRAEIAELEDDLRGFRGKSRAAERRYEELEHRLASRATAETVAEITEELRQTRIEIESFAELIADREGKLAAVRSQLDDASGRLGQARAPIDALDSRLAAVPPPPILPLGGLLAPGVGVREVSLAAPIVKADGDGVVDRCVTCHLAAVRDDLEAGAWPAPLRPHPRPELFVGAGSPHPYERFGCVTCHGGDGRATDHARAGHLSAPAEPGWDARPAILPLDLTEAACGRCHGREVFTPEAPAFGQGLRLIATLGCTGCHASEHPALRALQKSGPSLAGIAAKTTPAWAYAWLSDSGDARRPTRVPHAVGSDGQAAGDRSAEARAVVDFLWHASRPTDHEPPPAGDAEAGRALFGTIGCTGCHRLDLERAPAARPERGHGPHLGGVGSKVAAAWLHAWLRDPSALSPGTPMPSLRLDDGEAADLTAYLGSQRDPAWEGLSVPDVDLETRDRLVLSALAAGHTLEQSQARLEGMSEWEKDHLLGESTIAREGCHECHEIAGFESATPAGAPLADVGRRLRARLDDRGPEPGWWQASSHRPAYRLNDDEARAVTVALLGLSDAREPLAGERLAVLARGRRIVTRYNCRGCHRVEGRGGDGVSPDLAHAGARLEGSWLADYLGDPGGWNVRPLEVRMPSFSLGEAEIDALVRYFAALDDRPLFAAELPMPRPDRDVAIGGAIYGMLQCGDCHRGEDAGPVAPWPVPDYALAAERLRPDWVVDWILDPERWLPGTPMPATFLPGDGGEPSSDFLIGSIDTPMFNVESGRLLGLLGSEEALRAYLSDPRRVASAMRDYLWTLGE